MKQKYLTKTRFSTALQCPTKLYYADNKDYTNTRNDDKFLLALAEGGFQVGTLAKYYHSGGYDINSLDQKKCVEETQKLLLNDKVIIYEAAIQFQNCFIRIDILIKDGNNIDLIEVKAKSYVSKENFYTAKGFIASSWLPYINDVAFQNWVLKQAMPNANIIPYLMLADKNKQTSIDGLNQFFKIKKNENNRTVIIVEEIVDEKKLGEKILIKVDVKDLVQMVYDGLDIQKKDVEESKSFEDRIKEYGNYYVKNKIYPPSIGKKCKSCEFKDPDKNKSGYYNCWSHIYPDFDLNDPHIFNIWNFRKSDKMIEQGIYKMEDIYSSSLASELNERQYLQVSKTVKNISGEDIDSELFNKMNTWEYPLHFIDFETCMIAIPFYKNKFPYEQIAFQFSCHTLHKDGRIEHNEWIESDANKFPNYNFVRALKDILDKDQGSIFRYSAHENTVLLQIQKQMMDSDDKKYAELIDWIDTITKRKDPHTKAPIEGDRNMIDLLDYVKKYYYHPKMGGSNSLKYVLPAIFSTSDFIKNKYQNNMTFGTHLKNNILWQCDPVTNETINPYKLLDNKYENENLNKENILFLNQKIQDGSAASMAYCKLQFAEMTNEEREILTDALLQYCELDTLAMLMIYEHWNSLR